MHTFRLARPDDARRIELLYGQLVKNPFVKVLPERIDLLSRDPSTALVVGEIEGQVEATALVSICADVMFGFQPFAVVENVVVDEDRRGQGLGAALLRHVQTLCVSGDCSKIMLLSSSQRTEAHKFFEKQGFASASKIGFVKYRRDFS